MLSVFIRVSSPFSTQGAPLLTGFQANHVPKGKLVNKTLNSFVLVGVACRVTCAVVNCFLFVIGVLSQLETHPGL